MQAGAPQDLRRIAEIAPRGVFPYAEGRLSVIKNGKLKRTCAAAQVLSLDFYKTALPLEFLQSPGKPLSEMFMISVFGLHK